MDAQKIDFEKMVIFDDRYWWISMKILKKKQWFFTNFSRKTKK